MSCVTPLRLAVALDGARQYPADDWTGLAQEAERGRLDFVTIENVDIATQMAAATSRIGLFPIATHHAAAQLAELDRASSGRGGWLADPVDAVDQQWDGVVAMLADGPDSYRFAARSADLVLVAPQDEDDVRQIVGAIREHEATARVGPALRIFADLVVFLDDTGPTAQARFDDAEFSSAAAIFVGTPNDLGRRLQSWQRAGIEGFRLIPGALPHDLQAITRGLVPSLQENDAFRRGYEARTLRALLGLPWVGARLESAG
jgi:alkanesulfonate monooxygenase SsuD/methylene tetrahydromethanopterin reductase-like flavin-dependent oxidoreductase (luciferase family)